MKETEGTLALAQDPQPLRPIELRTPRDYSLITTAIEHRSEELEKLIKKNKEEGYDREARVMEADNEALKHHILPQVRHQQELGL